MSVWPLSRDWWTLWMLAYAGCVVSDFDQVRERSPVTSAEAGAACDTELCTSESELDAQISASEPSEMDAALASQDDGAAQTPSEASADAADSASDAGGSDAEANSCVDADLVRDPQNCGHCGVDCSAMSARVTCENMRCVRACEDGFGDCNNDLVLGLMGNGCERMINGDPSNCGECRRRCTAPSDGYATCDKQLCNGHRLQLADSQAGTLFGNPSGGMAYNHDCPSGQVLVGIDGTGTTIVYGVGARCAPLKIAQVNGAITVATGTVTAIPPVGGLIDPPPPTFRRECPPGSFVTGIAGTLWNWPGNTVPSVKTLSLTCGSARVGADRKVSIVASAAPLTIGEEDVPPLTSFARPCTAPGAVSGISGRAGAYVDSIAVECGRLAIFTEPVGSSTAAAAAAVASQ